MVLVIARCPSSITVRKLKRYRFITSGGNYAAHLGLHSEVTGRVYRPGVKVLLGSRVESRFLSLLYW